jgi:coproporphyrinogen III oxidase
MRINLNDPNEFTIENVRKLIASHDDSVHTQFRVTKDGYLFLSERVGNRNLEGILFRLETNSSYAGYVGINASKNDHWVSCIYNVVKKNWPTPSSSYIDLFLFL